MNTYVVIALVLGIGLGVWFGRRRPKLIQDQAREKAENLGKIRAYFAKPSKANEKVTNKDIEELLGVSDATVTRYMDELERSGEVRQVGREGAYVYYQRVN